MVRKYLPFLMLITAGVTLMAYWARITHQSFGGDILNIAFVLLAASVILGLFEVFQSEKIEMFEKLMWALAFMFIPVISFIVYLRLRRDKVIGTRIAVKEGDNLN